MYGSRSDLVQQGIDLATLLGLISEGEEKENYECQDEEESAGNQSRFGCCFHKL